MESSEPPQDFKQRLKASYDAVAPKYNAWTEKHTPLRLAYVDELYTHVPRLGTADQEMSMLELGCGSGQHVLKTMLSRSSKLRAVANDLSDTQINLAREHLAQYGDRVSFVAGDMTQLSFEENSLTAVVALYSVIHLPRTEQQEMLAKIANWLEPGGCLLINISAVVQQGIVKEHWLDEKGWMYWSGLGEDVAIKGLTEAGLKVARRKVEGDSEESFLWIIATKG